MLVLLLLDGAAVACAVILEKSSRRFNTSLASFFASVLAPRLYATILGLIRGSLTSSPVFVVTMTVLVSKSDARGIFRPNFLAMSFGDLSSRFRNSYNLPAEVARVLVWRASCLLKPS